MIIYSKYFMFNKIDYNHTGRKSNAVDIEINLKEIDGKICFTASGSVWNTKHTDIIMGGQCLDDIYKEYANQIDNIKLFKTIMKLWQKWHLNDMNAGCKHQRKLKWTYNEHQGECCPTCGYQIGTDWKYRRISQNDLITICELLGIEPLESLRLLRLNKKLKSD